VVSIGATVVPLGAGGGGGAGGGLGAGDDGVVGVVDGADTLSDPPQPASAAAVMRQASGSRIVVDIRAVRASLATPGVPQDRRFS